MIEPDGRRGFGGSLLLPVAAIAVLVVIVALLALLLTGGGDSEDDASLPTPTVAVTLTVAAGSLPESAIDQYVATTQEVGYAGECAEAELPADVGKLCSIYVGERDGVHAFVLGLTFSEGLEWAFVEMQAGAWRVAEAMAITLENAGVPGIPWPLKVGAEVVIIGTGTCLNVRTEPGGDVVDCITEGSAIVLAAGPEEARELKWWRIEGRDGWVAADFLRYPDATANPAPTPTSEPASDATPEATQTP